MYGCSVPAVITKSQVRLPTLDRGEKTSQQVIENLPVVRRRPVPGITNSRSSLVDIPDVSVTVGTTMREDLNFGRSDDQFRKSEAVLNPIA
jgi:hypothetical protein